MSDGFYRAFEEVYRGTRGLIKSRLHVYLPFVEPLAKIEKGAQTIDLGCGRGEWLELMLEAGFKPHGVDLDEAMLSSCIELGLSVDKGDAIAYLAALPRDSQMIVSAFHLVEHISFEQLQSLVSESLRVLKPGGLLIMETPNPENIAVSTCSFYLDPTHQRPIPPQLLSFVPEHYGFERIKIIRLQESRRFSVNEPLHLIDVFEGASPDYAVIAQKAASTDVFQSIDSAFEKEYGVKFETIAALYDAQAERRFNQAQAQTDQLHQALLLVLNSRSWRITAPLRRAIEISNLVREHLKLKLTRLKVFILKCLGRSSK
jgi:SAM-dependent methyltransferase